jgi:hypothetical protein
MGSCKHGTVARDDTRLQLDTLFLKLEDLATLRSVAGRPACARDPRVRIAGKGFHCAGVGIGSGGGGAWETPSHTFRLFRAKLNEEARRLKGIAEDQRFHNWTPNSSKCSVHAA